MNIIYQVQIVVLKSFDPISLVHIYYRGGGMDAARWTELQGCTLCPTKDFCYFSSLKSKAKTLYTPHSEFR